MAPEGELVMNITDSFEPYIFDISNELEVTFPPVSAVTISTYKPRTGGDQLIALGTKNGECQVRQWPSGDSLFAYQTSTSSAISSIAYTNDGSHIALGTQDGDIHVWLTGGTRPYVFQLGLQGPTSRHFAPITDLSFTNSKDKLISSSDDGTVIIWDLENNGTVRQVLSGHTGRIIATRFLSMDNSSRFYTLDENGLLLYWRFNPESMAVVYDRLHLNAMVARPNQITAFLPSREGQLSFIGTLGGEIQVWNLISKKLLRVLKGSESEVRSIGFSPLSKQLLAVDGEGRVLHWKNLELPIDYDSPVGNSGLVHSIDVSTDGQQIITSSTERVVKTWDSNGQLLDSIQTGLSTTQEVRFAHSPNSREVLIKDERNAFIWSLSLDSLRRVPGFGFELRTAAYSRDDQSVLTAGIEQLPTFCSSNCTTIRKYSVADLSLQQERSIDLGCYQLLPSPINPDEFLTVDEDHVIAKWNWENPQPLNSYAFHSATINDMDYSADGAWLISGSDDRTAVLWDLSTGALMRRFILPEEVKSVRFIPPIGRSIAISAGSTIYIWDAESGKLKMAFGHGDNITDIAVTPNGRWLLSSSLDRKIRKWSLSDL